MGNDVTITLTSVDKSSGAIKKVTATYDELNDQIERFIKNERANIVADNAKKAFEGMTAAQKDAFLAARQLDDQQSKSISTSSNLKNSWTELNSAIGVVKQGYESMRQAYAATVGEFLDQAAAVRSLALATGAGAEETSRMIQVFDDAGINTDNLKTAMLAMKNDGLEPSIDTIAKLSDEYAKLKTPLERTTFLTDHFGSRGVELGKVFEKTGKQIRDAGAAIDEGMIFDDAKIAKAEEMRIAMDNLSDSWLSFKNDAVLPVLPALADGIQYLADYVAELRKAKNYFEMVSTSLGFWIGKSDDARKATEKGTLATNIFNQTLSAGKTALDDYSLAIGGEFVKVTEGSTNVTDEYAHAMLAARDAMSVYTSDSIEANRAMFEAIDTGIQSTIDRVQEQIDFMNAGGAQFIAAWNKAYEEFLKDPGNPETQRRIDEMDARSQALQVNLGNISADAAAQNIADTLGVSLEDAAKILYALQAELARGATMTVNVVYNDPGWGGSGGGTYTPPGKGGTGGGGGTGTTTPIMDAYGGPVRAGETHIYNENPATSPEVPVLNSNGTGYILTKQDAQQAVAGSGGGSFNFGPGSVIINVGSGNADEIAKKLLPSLQKLVERNRNAGTGR